MKTKRRKKYNKKTFRKKSYKKQSYRKKSYKKKYLKGRGAAEDIRYNMINNYVIIVGNDLKVAEDSQQNRVFSDDEITALKDSIKRCAHEIMNRWTEQNSSKAKLSLSEHSNNILAACTLARKAILGYDADADMTSETFNNEHKYNKWILNFLANNEWKPCVNEERQSGELPTSPKQKREVSPQATERAEPVKQYKQSLNPRTLLHSQKKKYFKKFFKKIVYI